jgi:putative glycosyltransferase (TIGR04372 family)
MQKLVTNVKLLIKYFFQFIGYSVQKRDEKNILIKKAKLIDDYKKRKIFLKKIINKYPSDITFQLLLFECSLELNDIDFIENLNLFSEKKIKWEKKNYLKDLNIELIPQLIFMGALGNTLQLRTLIDANKLKLRKDKKIYLIWNKKHRINNKILFNYFKEHFTLIEEREAEDDFDTLSIKLEAPLRVCINFNNTALTLPHASNYVETKKLGTKYENIPFFQIKSDHKKFGENKLKELGIPSNSWYVTLHIREPEPNYRGETKFNTTENFRNANPENYYGAIREIVSKGGFVFRMGSSSLTPMPKMQGLIDYANSSFKSELMDVFLGATSKFCIANSSGFHSIPSFFSVPRLLTDVPNHQVYFFLNKNDIYLPRLFLDLKTNNKIKFKEYFSYPLNALGSDRAFDNYKLQPLHNSKNELAEATREMINKVILKKDINFNNVYQEKIKKIIKDSSFTQTGVEFKALADISPNFLNNNRDLF